MQPPKLISIIKEINHRHQTNLPYVKSMDELALIINDLKKQKGIKLNHES